MDTALWLLAGILLAFVLVWLRHRFASFAAQRPEDYESGDPFDLRTHLNGALQCDGVIYGPTGRVASRFTADFDARWEGNRCVMAEHFHYDSGSRQDREWRLDLGNDGRLRALADDVVGTGTGRQHGSALHLKYRIRLAEDAGGHVLSVTDWMYLAPDGAIVNRSQFRKFGIKVAELVAVMRRKDTDTKGRAA
ncbi:DUF3833 domain-containing protein [Lutimaribacter sp. EGI FJ00015]|uniref:DUF3833 domain-containing protein n=1 Tax=Lutimaribacter degradans TaxID=2945989 RepID=A0ACC5ZYV0_9RHOB|nr:DUF3833 domain-containing protein [Lutimaribacter sp. EGI FJ00013]MCM2562926.1 DUF3833 domain-containing protein [Lutimaribacter sp. EGI FJ00013]MCO0614094.1 DUF3833 domain-containing protein [Lutimaribacter sp. EGI FJ00015]MCO0636071.1 DUF3833 domain-containing protein [Lutimaribacter sp. EGI FJ00014]